MIEKKIREELAKAPYRPGTEDVNEMHVNTNAVRVIRNEMQTDTQMCSRHSGQDSILSQCACFCERVGCTLQDVQISSVVWTVTCADNVRTAVLA